MSAAISASVQRRVRDRKSTRLNSSHMSISYAVFCLKKKNLRDSEPGFELPLAVPGIGRGGHAQSGERLSLFLPLCRLPLRASMSHRIRILFGRLQVLRQCIGAVDRYWSERSAWAEVVGESIVLVTS